MMIFQVLVKKWWFFQVLTKIDDFSKFGKKWWFLKKKLKNYYFFKFCQKMMISQNTSKNDDFSNSCKKMMIFSNLLLKLFSKMLVSANLLVKWLMLYVAFNVSTYVVCWMFFVGFQCCDICRDIGQSTYYYKIPRYYLHIPWIFIVLRWALCIFYILQSSSTITYSLLEDLDFSKYFLL